ncbi:phenylcoumaran benzylic ether reductase Pyrc5 isoform X2 [Eucalyptus grandis]|uniref:Uncharacterized protein n=2 Tax=Eucalyptus grandis TaxID=71139 RepID=A0ACC3LTF1_EUCGR|nr:phenylcoumaran benzylic ether reductase Pyrc5 isoform X2 [Eucalyptus grandis]KAK3441737.1 hypothetical protein EUGRSUZ_B01777 [Eucalyptus grandis]
MAEKSRVLVIGGTGHIGKFIVEASAKFGHPTFALVRESSLSDPAKANIAERFKSLGVNLVHRFLPSEFGNDVNRVHPVEPVKAVYDIKAKIRRLIEAEGIPYTYVVCNCFADEYLRKLAQHEATAPPRDKVVILGDGNAKAVFNKEDDIGTYTIKAVDDPRTLNKIMYIKPPANIYSFNELVSLWERKIGKTLERVYVPDEEILKNIQEAAVPLNFILAAFRDVLVNGDQTNFEIEPSFEVEALELYPDVKYTTVDQYMDQFV